MNFCVLIVLIFAFPKIPVFSRPIKLHHNFTVQVSKIPSYETFNFMKRYGYLEQNKGSEASYSEDAIIEAIKTVQKFGAIPQTGIVDNATLQLMKARRCGMPDIIRNTRSKRYVLGSSKWLKRHITYFLANWTPKLGEEIISKTIQLALNAWGKYGRLTFTRTINHFDADIIVIFARGDHGDSFPFDGPGTILAHAFYPQDYGYGGDIHFDEDEEWTVYTEESQEGTDFFTVAIHELGHSLGLSHSSVETSIMFPYYQGFSSDFELDYDDIMGMYELYIRGFSDVQNYSTPTPKPTENPFDEYDISWGDENENVTPRIVVENRTIVYEDDDDKGGSPQKPSEASIPDICEGNFDAVATLRKELFIFKEKYIWRLKTWQEIDPGYPITLKQMFPNLPENITKVDAVYERPDGLIVLFTGKEYWVHNGHGFVEDSPRPLGNYGLPHYVNEVDAVQIWAKNGKTYLYKNDRFWRYNETTKLMDDDYPKHMEKWRKVPENLDAATTWIDGYTYFFKGKYFWKFDNVWTIAMDPYPLPTPQIWLGCPEKEDIAEFYSQN